MLPRTRLYSERCREKRQPTISKHGCCQIWPDLQIWAAQIWPDLGKFFFFLKKNFFPDVPDLARSGQIWPHLGDLGRLGKFFFPGTPNDITKYRLKYRSIYVARVCKLRSRTHKVYQTINQSDKRYIIGKLLAPPPCLRIYYVDRPNSVGLRRSSAKHWGSTWEPTPNNTGYRSSRWGVAGVWGERKSILVSYSRKFLSLHNWEGCYHCLILFVHVNR